jgi:hypothetical protein
LRKRAQQWSWWKKFTGKRKAESNKPKPQTGPKYENRTGRKNQRIQRLHCEIDQDFSFVFALTLSAFNFFL